MFHPEKSGSVKKIRELFETSELPNDLTNSLKSAYNKLNNRINLRETLYSTRSNTVTISRNIGDSLRSTYSKLSEKLNLKDESSDENSSDAQAKDTKDNDFNCPNKDCGQVFSRPLKALNLQKDAPTQYYACPNCLTEITVEEDFEFPREETIKFELPQELEPETEAELESELEPEPEPKQISSSEEATSCRHHLGYLSERESKDSIPDECMTCMNIVDCMLKRVNQ